MSIRSCRPRANPALLAELDALVRRREWLEAQCARVEMGIALMREGGWRLERE
jgi:hypothetical protein